MPSTFLSSRPKVLSLREPEFAGEEYLAECAKYFELEVSLNPSPSSTHSVTKQITHILQVLTASTREEAIRDIKERVARSGPYVAFMMLC